MLLFAVLIIVAMTFSNYWIVNTSADKLYADVNAIPVRDVGLVLGANKTAKHGINLYFKYRIEAAAQLFKAGKIKHIIVSGDNHIKEYDEATDMQQALIALGVPDTCITLDYAGFRTFDSVIRCNKVFGQKSFTIISQEFHNQRAVFIAQKNNINAICFNAKDVPAKYSFKTNMREYFAKFKCVLDIYLLHTSPKFLGEEVKIEI
jgi:SanA protein